MEFPFQVFLCLLFGVVCVVFIVWVFRQDNAGYITTTEIPIPQMGETVSSPPPAFSPPFGDISFTNMRLLVYYAQIAVVAASGRKGKPPEEDIPDIRDKAIDMVLAFCQADGYEIDGAANKAIPYVVDYRINELYTPRF